MISVNEWLDQFIEIQGKRNIKEKTLQEKIYFSKVLSLRLGNRPLDIIRTLDLFLIIDEYSKSDKQTQAVRIYQFIKQVFQKAWSRGVIENNPAFRLERPECEVKRERLELDEFLRILKISSFCAPDYFYIAMLAALITGRRSCELVNIKMDDIDDNYLNVNTAKNGVIVSIPLDLRVEKIGTSLRDLFIMSKGNKYLIEREGNKPKVTVHSLSTWFSQMRQAASIEAREGRTPPTFYEIRSLSEKLYNEQGINTQKLLGHISINSTRIYADRRDKGNRKTIVEE